MTTDNTTTWAIDASHAEVGFSVRHLMISTVRGRFGGIEGTVTLDCRGLEYISSAGLGVLLKTQKRLAGSSGKLRLTGVSRHLQDIFLYSGFDQIFEIEPAR